LDYATVFRLAAAGDAVAGEAVAHSIRVWAAAIVSLIHAYDPERVVVGGGLMRSSEMILPGLRDYVSRHAWTPWGKVEVAPAVLGNRAGMLGVADLLQQRLTGRNAR
jgi:glucokinase